MGFTRTAAGGVWGSTGQKASVQKAAEASAAKRRKNHPLPTGRAPAAAPEAPKGRSYSAAQVSSGSRMKGAAPAPKGPRTPAATPPPPKGRRPAAAKPSPKGRRKGTPDENAPAPMVGHGRDAGYKEETFTYKGNSFQVANGVAIVSTEADFHSPEVVNKSLTEGERIQARARSQDIFNEAIEKAPAIQGALRQTVAQTGGKMGREIDEKTGAPTAVKSQHSTYRKVQAKIESAKARGGDPSAERVRLADAVRFTAVLDDEKYTEGVASLRASLEALGYKQIEPPPDATTGWALGAYRGLNMNFRDESGFTFEVQAHTQQSVDAAEAIHPLYDVTRANDQQVADMMADTGPKGGKAKTGIDPTGLTVKQYKVKAHEKSVGIAESVPVPKGVAIFRDRDTTTDIVHTPTKTGHFSARSAAPLPKPGTAAGKARAKSTTKGQVASSEFGMNYAPGNAKVVEKARAASESDWEKLPVQSLPHGTPLQANEKMLTAKSIDKVVGGTEKFREGYVTKLYRAPDGGLHVVDGHHRVAMHHALGKDMPVQIMEDKPTPARRYNAAKVSSGGRMKRRAPSKAKA
jgi:hypothetical protein